MRTSAAAHGARGSRQVRWETC